MNHMQNRFFISSAAAMVLLLAVSSSFAALPPGAVDAMKKDATDHVALKIIKVQRIKSEKKTAGYINLVYTAKVTKVKRSKSGLKPGAVITIKAYHWSKAGLLPPGPKNPPLLKADWVGSIYLNAVDLKKHHFKLAAYGHSFD